MEHHVVALNLCSLTVDIYARFIDDFRQALSTEEKSLNAYWLRRWSTCPLTDSGRIVLVDLIVDSEGTKVTFSINTPNIYLRAFRIRNKAWFFKDITDEEIGITFEGTENTRLPYTGSYAGLGHKLKEGMTLSFPLLKSILSGLYTKSDCHYRGVDTPRKQALVMVIMMVCESARFDYLKSNLIKTLGDRDPNKPYKPVVDGFVVELVRNWNKHAKFIDANKEELENKWETEWKNMMDEDLKNVMIQGFSAMCLCTIMLMQPTDEAGTSTEAEERLPKKSASKVVDRKGKNKMQ